MISTRSLTESLERKYNLNESFVELEESFIFRPTPDDEPGEWGLDTQEELEREILQYDGKKIIKMVQTIGNGYFNITLEDQTYLEGVSEECIVRSTDESLNEAQLNENPLLAAAARAAIPAAIDVASNAISSAIDAKLHEEDNLEEDYWNPTPWFYDLTNNYETWSGEEWNNWSQEERDAAVTKAVKHFLIDNELSEYEVEEFRSDLEDNNFHTEARILSELCDTITESLSDEDIYDNLAGKLFNAAERFFMYSSDKITYDEWIRACEKAFFALEDEGHTCDYSNSINEDITEDMEYAVGDNETGYTYKSYEQALKAVKQQIEMAASVDGCEMITIQVVPTDGAGNEL